MQHTFNLCATKVGNIKQILMELDFIYTLLSLQKYLHVNVLYTPSLKIYQISCKFERKISIEKNCVSFNMNETAYLHKCHALYYRSHYNV